MPDVFCSVKVPIAYAQLSGYEKQRLRQMLGRDSRCIKDFLGVIEEHEKELLTGKNNDRVEKGQLAKLTMTAIKGVPVRKQRLSVPHDMKARYRRSSVHEIYECMDTAIAMYEAYLKLRKKLGASRPCAVNKSRCVPRNAYTRCFELIESESSRWTLDLRDSLDSSPQGRFRHDRLKIPLKVSDYHRERLQQGEVKSLKIFTDSSGKWWVSFSVKVDIPTPEEEGKPVSVLGIDLGIKKAAVTTLVTPEKVRGTRYFIQESKALLIEKYDRRVAELQRELATRRNNGLPYDSVAKELRRIRHKRLDIAKNYDSVLITHLLDYIEELSKDYTLYVSIGKLKGIRKLARKGNYRGRRFRGMLHSWAFHRITETLRFKLELLGWPTKGKSSWFRVVSEHGTSSKCWKCGRKGIRPYQNYFVCHTCGHRTNADRNGAINIAAKTITLTPLLHEVRGLGNWASSVERGLRLKTRGTSLEEVSEEVLTLYNRESSVSEGAR